MKKAISFLGKGQYKEVIYVWKDKQIKTHLFPEAVAEIFQPEEVIVLLTPSAKNYRPPKGEQCPECNQALPEPLEEETYWETLQKRLKNKVKLEEREIPEGKSEEELWEIFDICTQVVEKGDEVILDITHAFRSLPLIVFAAAVYLKRVKGVKIEAILYGAYEAKEEDRVPIFDSTKLIDLFDWMIGVEFLRQRSDAAFLAEQIAETQNRLWKENQQGERPTKLKKLGEGLKKISQALQLLRPLKVMEFSQELLPLFEQASDEVKTWAKPFGVVLDEIKREIKELAYECDSQKLTGENLRRQLAIIRHYIDKGRYTEGILLTREWIVDLVAYKNLKEEWLDRDYRTNTIELALNSSLKKKKGEEALVPEWFEQLAESEKLVKLWGQIRDLRNSIAHCGKTKGAQEIPTSIEKQLKEIYSMLEKLLD